MSKSSNFIQQAFSYNYLFILGFITLLSSAELYALDLEKTGAKLTLKPRLLELPDLPQVPGDEMIDPIEVACSGLRSMLRNFNPLPLIDWINVSNLPSFFDPTIRSLMKQEEYFNAIDSLGKYDLAVQPHGFYSNYKLGSETFKLTTFGVTVDGGVALDERWVVGGGLGYWHSNLDWGGHAKNNSVNSLYFGPYVGYLFDRAYIDLMLIGVYNIYNINHLFEDSKRRHNGWDAAARLEGGWDYEWPRYFGKRFFIQPNGELSYLMVFQNEIKEESKLYPDEISTTVNSRSYGFFRSRLAVTFKKEFHDVEKGILIPSLSVGWVLMQPITHSKICFTCSQTNAEEEVKNKAYPSSNQAYLRLRVQGINKRGMMLTLDGEAYFARFYPVYLGTLRFEWDW